VAHIYAGEFDRALALSEEASEISESIDNTWGRSYRLWKLGIVYAEWGEWSRALNTMEECIRLGELAGFLPSQTQTRADLAALYGELGATRLGKEMVRLALSTGESSEHLIDRGTVLAALASLHLVDGDCNAATDAIEEAKSNPYLDTWRVFGIPVRLTIAEVALAQGENDCAAAAMKKLLIDLQQFGTRVYTPYALYLLGAALAKLGKAVKARERWLEARKKAEGLGSRRILWRILYALSQIESDPIETERLLDGARQNLAYIVDHIEQAELKESFLNRPDVRAVLE
jgi:tetratricopeptide (TPR) repeat protein